MAATLPPRFYIGESLRAGEAVMVGEDAARHMRVRRLGVGSPVMLLDGQGVRADGVVQALAKRNARIDVLSASTVAPDVELHALVPIADRDRMLWLAEKAAEIGVTSWRPVLWRHSRSVAPRGEGGAFQQKVRARMIGALEQSGNAWLPSVFPDAKLAHALAGLPVSRRFVLDPAGAPLYQLLAGAGGGGVTIALGPEGGLDDDERDALAEAGFVPASLGPSILRFETAGIAALALARAMAHSAEH